MNIVLKKNDELFEKLSVVTSDFAEFLPTIVASDRVMSEEKYEVFIAQYNSFLDDIDEISNEVVDYIKTLNPDFDY